MSEKVGVYICHCGSNIAGTVDVVEVARLAGELPGVTVAREYKFMCSSLGQELVGRGHQEARADARRGRRVLAPPAREDLPACRRQPPA